MWGAEARGESKYCTTVDNSPIIYAYKIYYGKKMCVEMEDLALS